MSWDPSFPLFALRTCHEATITSKILDELLNYSQTECSKCGESLHSDPTLRLVGHSVEHLPSCPITQKVSQLLATDQGRARLFVPPMDRQCALSSPLDLPSQPVLFGVTEALTSWLVQAQQFAEKQHRKMCNFILEGGRIPSGSGLPLEITSAFPDVKTAGRYVKILTPMRLLHDDPSAGTLGCDALKFLMLPSSCQRCVILQALISDVALTGKSSQSHPKKHDSEKIYEIVATVAALAEADDTIVYRFPDGKQNHAAQQLLIRLSYGGFVFPMNHQQHGELFFITPALRQAVLSVASRVTEDFNPKKRSRTTEKSFPLRSLRSMIAATANHTGRSASVSNESPQADTIITETNFRLYVFLKQPDPRTGELPQSSRTLLRLLAQFAVEDVVAGSFAVFRLDRATFLEACRSRGIKRADVVMFLTSRAHRQAVANGDPAVPESIADQLALWEREAQRVMFKDTSAVLLNFSTWAAKNYVMELLPQSAAGTAEERGILLERTLSLVLTKTVFEQYVAEALSTS